MRQRIGWILLALGLGLVALLGTSEALQAARREGALPNGRPAPALVGTLADGTPFDAAVFRGHPILVAFWATWCPPCRAELPMLDTLAKEYAAKGVVFAAANLDEGGGSGALAARFLADHQIQSLLLFQPDDATADRWKIENLPALYVLDGAGRIVEGFSGSTWERSLRKALDAATASSSAAPTR